MAWEAALNGINARTAVVVLMVAFVETNRNCPGVLIFSFADAQVLICRCPSYDLQLPQLFSGQASAQTDGNLTAYLK